MHYYKKALKVRKKDLAVDPELVEFEEKLAESLGTRVQIERKEVGGKVIIDFFTNEDVKKIIGLLHNEIKRDPNETLREYEKNNRESIEQRKMESVLVMCNRGPFGSNSAYEAIRLGAGFMGLGEDINCKILFHGDAVLSVKKNLNSNKIGMDSYAEGFEMADLSELPIIVIEEDLLTRGMTAADLVEL